MPRKKEPAEKSKILSAVEHPAPPATLNSHVVQQLQLSLAIGIAVPDGPRRSQTALNGRVPPRTTSTAPNGRVRPGTGATGHERPRAAVNRHDRPRPAGNLPKGKGFGATPKPSFGLGVRPRKRSESPTRKRGVPPPHGGGFMSPQRAQLVASTFCRAACVLRNGSHTKTLRHRRRLLSKKVNERNLLVR